MHNFSNNFLAVPIEKQVIRINKNGEETVKNISYILQFIYSGRFMASLLSNLVNNLSEGVHRIKCKYEYDDKKYETCRIKNKRWECFLEHTNFKDDLMEHKLWFALRPAKQFYKKLKEQFLLLADVFAKFRNMCLEIYELHPEKFVEATRLACLKKTKKKVLQEKYVIIFIDTQKLITNTWKITRKIKNRHIFIIGNLYGWEMSQKLLVNNFQWLKDTSQFNEDFIKS